MRRDGMCKQRAATRVSFSGQSRAWLRGVACLAWMIVPLAASPVFAQTPADFFRGKTISLLIGFGPGGEDDLWARTVVRHLMTHIPGNPNVVPVHTPGSGGLLVANRL